jgi:hypothetical protein
MSATNFGDPDQIIHIPARDLTGPRDAKLAELDMLLAQLQVVRLALCGQPVQLAGSIEAPGEPGRPRDRSRRPGLARAVLSLLGQRAGFTKEGRR